MIVLACSSPKRLKIKAGRFVYRLQNQQPDCTMRLFHAKPQSWASDAVGSSSHPPDCCLSHPTTPLPNHHHSLSFQPNVYGPKLDLELRQPDPHLLFGATYSLCTAHRYPSHVTPAPDTSLTSARPRWRTRQPPRPSPAAASSWCSSAKQP